MARQRPLFVFQFNSATSAEWAAANPLLKNGRLYYATDLRLVKIGLGTQHWNTAPYAFAGAAGPPGPRGPSGCSEDTDMSQATQTITDFTLPADTTPQPVLPLYAFLEPQSSYLLEAALQITCDNNADGISFQAGFAIPPDATVAPQESLLTDAGNSLLPALSADGTRPDIYPDPSGAYNVTIRAVISTAATAATVNPFLKSSDTPAASVFTIPARATLVATKLKS